MESHHFTKITGNFFIQMPCITPEPCLNKVIVRHLGLQYITVKILGDLEVQVWTIQDRQLTKY